MKKLRTLLFLIAALIHFSGNAQLFKTTEKLNEMDAAGGVLQIKDSLLFMAGGINSGKKQFTNLSVQKGVIIFSADSPGKIIRIFSADGATVIRDYVSDGAGGFYLAGFFGVFNGVSIGNHSIVRIKRDMSVVINFSLTFNTAVNKILLIKNRIIALGNFTSVNSNSCLYLAALDTTNLAFISGFKPPFTSASYQFVVPYQDKLLVSGSFTVGTTVYKMVILDALSGNILKSYNNLSFTPAYCQIWNDIAFLGSNSKINFPANHGYLFSYNLTDSSLSATRNIRVNAIPAAMHIANDKLYLSMNKITGYDTITVNGLRIPHQGLAVIDLNKAKLLPDIYPVDDLPVSIAAYKDKLFRYGSMNKISGYITSNFIATDTLTNTAINPDFPFTSASGSSKLALSQNYGILDYFSGVDYEKRFGVGALNMNTMKVNSFNPKIANSAAIRAMRIVDSTVFLAGFFTQAEGRTVSHFAAYNYITNTLDTTHNLLFNAIVNTMEVLNDSILLFGGQFTTVNTKSRNCYMAYNFRTKTISSNYQAAFNQPLTMITRIDSQVFFAGSFTTVNSQTKNYLVAAKVIGSMLGFNYGNFKTTISVMTKVVVYNKKYYFISNTASDTNVIVFDFNGNKISPLSFKFTYMVDCAPIGNYMVYGGTFTSFSGSTTNKNLIITRHDNGYPAVNNSIMSYPYPTNRMINRGDTAIYYFCNSTINRISYNPLPYIEPPESPLDFTCQKSGLVSYSSNSVFNPGNQFILEASTITTFTNPIQLGKTISIAPSGFIAADLTPLVQNTNYIYRIRSTDPVINGWASLFVPYKRPTGTISLLSGDTNCLAYSYGTYNLQFTGISTSSMNYSVDNSSYNNFNWSNYRLTVKWLDGPSGLIKITAQDQNSCAIDTFKIQVNIQNSPYNGFSEKLRKVITVFPNAIKDQVTILNEEKLDLHYAIYDVSGREILRDHASGNALIATGKLTPGFYTLFVSSGAERISYKLIKS